MVQTNRNAGVGVGPCVNPRDRVAATTDPGTLITLQAEHDQTVGDLVRYYNLNNDPTDAAALLAGYNMYRQALPIYFTEGDYTDAQTMEDNLTLANYDDSLYAWEMQLAINLYSAGNTWFNLDTASIDSMMGLAQYNSSAGYMAGGILALLGAGVVKWPIPLLDTGALNASVDTSGGGDRKPNPNGSNNGNGNSPITNINKTGTQSFSVYPNPTYGNLSITASASGTFTLFTLLGQQLQQYPVVSGQTDIQIPTILTPGIYMGEYKPVDGSASVQVKLIYQP